MLPAVVKLPATVDEDWDMNPFVILRSEEKTFVPAKVLLSTRSVDDAELPLPFVMHVPFTAKQPPARLIPRANVEVAVVPVMLRYDAEMPPVNVEVAVPETLTFLTVRSPYNVEVAAAKLATPLMERTEPGVVVPMPTLPLPRTVKREAPVVDETPKSDVLPLCCAALVTESWAHGVVVPTPTVPLNEFAPTPRV
jgi:hypothetical protein